MNRQIEQYFQHQAERIAGAHGPTATCTIVEIRGTDRPDCLFELEDENGCWRGWLHEGESFADIRWRDYVVA